MNIDNCELLTRLMAIREACSNAMSPVDINLNLVIVEIDKLAVINIEHLAEK